jgi:isopenicillin N synthase-like dioxygenase
MQHDRRGWNAPCLNLRLIRPDCRHYMGHRVPFIDLAPYYAASRDAEALRGLLDGMDRALCEIGFLCIKGHPVDSRAIAEAQEIARRFFDSDEALKQTARAVRHKTRGYTPLGGHALAYTMTGHGARPPSDLFERYRIGPFDLPDDDYHRVRADGAYAPNVWPEFLPEFRTVLRAYYRGMSGLARDLMRIFALALGLEERWFDRLIDREMSSLCVNHYPAPERQPLPGQLRAGAHTDYGTLTIVAPTDAPGALQVRVRSGEWEDVAVPAGSFVVNIGDMMAQWTNDRWVSTLHRVANPPLQLAGASRRLSLVFFHQPNPDAMVECIPTCLDAATPPKYGPVTAGDYIARKISLHFQSYRSA